MPTAIPYFPGYPGYTGNVNAPSASVSFGFETMRHDLKPTSKDAAASQETVAGDGSLIPVIYGVRRRGPLVAGVKFNGSTLLLLCIWALGEVDAIEDCGINDVSLPLEGVSVTHYTGTQSQVADPDLVTAFGLTGYLYTDTLPGVCYSVFSIGPGADVQGFPRPWVRIRGKKVRCVEYAYVDFSGTKYCSTPDATQNDVDADFTVDACLTPTSWGSGTTRQPFVAKSTAYAFGLYGRALELKVNATTYTSSVDVPFTDGERGFARVVFRKDNGSNSDATFYTSDDGIVWTQLGTTQTAATIATITNSSAAVQVARDASSNQLTGKVYEVKLWTAAGLVLHFLPWEQDASASTWTGPAGEVWTGQNGAAIPAEFFAYSNIPANCLADFLRSATYGAGGAVDLRTTLHTYSRNVEQIGSPAENRHEIDLALDVQQETSTWVGVLAEYAHCTVVDEGGVYYLVRDADDAAAMAFEPDVNIIAGTLRLRKKRPSEQPTVIRVAYTDTTQDVWSDRTYDEPLPAVLDGSAHRRVSELSKPGILRYSQARREAIEALNKSTAQDLIVSFVSDDSGAKLRKGEIFTLTHPVGLDEKPFRCTSRSVVSPGRYAFTGEEHDPTVYSDDVITAPSIADTALDVASSPPAVDGLAMAEDIYQDQTGAWRSRWVITWDDPDYPFVGGFSVTIAQGGATVQGPVTVPKGATEFVSQPLAEGKQYDVTVRIVSTSGVSGTAASASAVNDGKAAVPSDVGAFSGFEVGGQVRLLWTPATDLDLTGHEVRYMDRETADAAGSLANQWAAATVLDRIAAPAVRYETRAVQAGDWRFFIKGLDSVRTVDYPYGQESATPATVDIVVTSDDLSFDTGEHLFTSPTLTNMTAYAVDGVTRWVTDFGDGIGYGHSNTDNAVGTFTDKASTVFAVPKSGTVSTWLSESWDYGDEISGTFSAAVKYTVLAGVSSTRIWLETSTDNSTWTQFVPDTASTTARYFRVRIETEDAIVVEEVKAVIRAAPRSESGTVTTASSGPTIVMLSNGYAKAQLINLQPIGTAMRTAMADSVVTSGGRGIPGRYALKFSGGDDHVTIADHSALDISTADICVEVMCKRMGAGGSANETFVKKTANYGFRLHTDGTLRAYYWYSDGNRYNFTSTYAVPLGEWVRLSWVMFVGFGVEGGFYVDGVPVNCTITQQVQARTLTNPLTFGGDGNVSSTEGFNGYIGDVRLWSAARSQSNIRADMRKALTGSESGLLGYWDFSDGTGTTLSDITSNSNDGTLVNSPVWRPYDGFDAYLFNSSGTQIAGDVMWTFRGA